MEYVFELDKTSMNNFFEYVSNLGYWSLNHEYYNRLIEANKIINRDDKLREMLQSNVFKKDYPRLWIGKQFNLTEGDDIPKVRSVIRRGLEDCVNWTRRKTLAVEMSGYRSGHKQPETAGIVVSSRARPENVVADLTATHDLLLAMRQDKASLRDRLSECLEQKCTPQQMYCLYMAERRIRPQRDLYEVVTDGTVNKAKVISSWDHRQGLFKEEGDWHANKSTELV